MHRWPDCHRSMGYALFGTSRQVITGPSATVAAVSASAVGLIAAPGSSDFVQFSAAIAIVAGLIYIGLGLARMGWIANFLSQAVLGGFVFAFGVGLIINQSHKILGVDGPSGSYVQQLWSTLKEVPDTSGVTLVVGAAAIVLLLLMRRFVPHWPRALMVVALGVAVSAALNLGDHGVAIVGHVPTGLPAFGVPDMSWSIAPTLVMGGLALVFVGFSESLASASAVAAKHDYEIDPSQEMLAQGTANVGSGLLGGFTVDGSLSKTTVADLAGQRTLVASLVTSGLIVLTVLLLAGLFTDLPDAVLGAVVIDAAIGLIQLPALRRVMTTSRTDFAAYVAAGIGLLFVGVLAGVVIGVVLSLLLLIAASSKSPVRRMAFDERNDVFVTAEAHPDAEPIPGVLVVKINGPLFFADANNFRRSVLEMAALDQPHAVVIDLEAASMIDLDGADILTKVHKSLEGKRVKMALAHVGHDQLELLRRAGTLEAIGEENLFPTVRSAAEALSGDRAREGAALSGNRIPL
jgi:SulP family sulfate permease